MGKYSMRDLAKDVLEANKTAMSSQEIWGAAGKELQDKVGYSGSTSPHLNLYNTLNADVKNNPSSLFKKVSKNPALFALKSTEVTKTQIEEKQEEYEEKSSLDVTESEYNEADLHPALAIYVNDCTHFSCRVKTIPQQTAKKGKRTCKDGEKIVDSWTYPDIIGIYFPFTDYDTTTTSVLESLKISALKVYSFEMKKSLTPSNLRKHFFQAVSNSSWANEGYLVAASISDDPEFTTELSMLCNSFGIGVIQLDLQSPKESKVLFPAKTRDTIDVDILDKLVDKSPEVKELFKTVNTCVSCKQFVTGDTFSFDEILSDDVYHEKTKNGFKGIAGRKK